MITSVIVLMYYIYTERQREMRHLKIMYIFVDWRSLSTDVFIELACLLLSCYDSV